MDISDTPLTAAISSQTNLPDVYHKFQAVQYEESSSIAIVSSSRLLHEGLTTALSRYLKIVVIANYDGALIPGEAGEAVQVVLLDSTLGRERVFLWLSYWRKQGTRVLILELPNDPHVIADHLQAGASSYCLQGKSVVEVAMAIQNVIKGKSYFAPDVTAEICSRLWKLGSPNREIVLPFALTPRETEILRCIAAGMSNQDIADHFVIHILTVKHHVHHILKKMNLSRRWDAARLAIEAGLTSEAISASP